MAAAPTNTDSNPTGTTDDGLPEQRHAGKVGYGPNYVAGPVSSLSIIQCYAFSCCTLFQDTWR
jgi:hypothetical protein